MSRARELKAGGLLERERELEEIDAALTAARAGEGAITLVEGPAGIGKTRLLAAARERAQRAGMAVLVARGSDLEREFRWGVVRQLLEAPLAGASPSERDELLSGSAQLAARLLSTGAATADAPDVDEGALLHGLYWLCANHAEHTPTLIIVDDAHWSDLPSLRFLAYLAHRIEGLALALLVGSRPGEAPRDDELLGRLGSEPVATVLHPGPLSSDAITAVLAARLGTKPDERFVAACRAASQGNPFLLEELARAARREHLAPDAAAADAVADLGPRSVARAIMRRVQGLAPGAVELARAVAVLGPDAEVRHAATLAGLDAAAAARAADALVAAEVLADSRPLDFIHPLARAAVYGELPSVHRARLHAEAGSMLARQGAPAERVAAHLLQTEPSGEEWTVAVLRAAGREAIGTGAPSAAASYLRRALAEPPPADEVGAVLHELGHAEAVDGQTAGFDQHLRRAMQLSLTPQRRASAALDLARAYGMAGDLGRAGQICLEALGDLGDNDPALAALLESELFTAALNAFELTEAAAPQLRRQIEQARDGRLDDAALLASVGLAHTVTIPPARAGVDAVMRAAAAGFPADNSLLPGSIGNALLFGGELEQAHRYMSQIGDEGRRRGLRSWVAWSSSMAARYSLELGQVRRAEEEAQLGLELMAQTVADPGPHARGYFTAHLAYALLERNRHDEAEQLLAGSDVPPGEARTYGAALLLGARSRLHLERGRAEDALACARASAATPLRDGNPAARPWRSDAARAFAALGQRDQARRLAQEELELARTFGTPHAITAALRAAARVDDDLSRSTSLLEEAIATVDDTAARLELTRAHVELGAVLRRAGKRRAAIEKLRVGLDLAHRAGATALAERAHRELLTAGARPRRALLSGVDALTVAERRVADLAAKGHTNQQIAQALFVTTRTVEAHLTRAFRKLDVKTRRELPLALADFDDDA